MPLAVRVAVVHEHAKSRARQAWISPRHKLVVLAIFFFFFFARVLIRRIASVDADTFIGKRDDVSGKIVVSWDIFRGGQDSWRRAEMAERYTEQTMRHARLQRDAFELVDKAWSARTLTANRIVALQRQLAADKKTIAIYRKEYEIGRRSLIDLLNAENQYFNAAASLTSARGVIVFADYQLLAAMGSLLDYLKTATPVDAAPLDTIPLGALPTKFPPIILSLPQSEFEPLDLTGWQNGTDQQPLTLSSAGRIGPWSPQRLRRRHLLPPGHKTDGECPGASRRCGKSRRV